MLPTCIQTKRFCSLQYSSLAATSDLSVSQNINLYRPTWGKFFLLVSSHGHSLSLHFLQWFLRCFPTTHLLPEHLQIQQMRKRLRGSWLNFTLFGTLGIVYTYMREFKGWRATTDQGFWLTWVLSFSPNFATAKKVTSTRPGLCSSKASFHDRTTTWVLLPVAKQTFVTGLLHGFCCQQQNKLSWQDY
jgi:hypothetical protein